MKDLMGKIGKFLQDASMVSFSSKIASTGMENVDRWVKNIDASRCIYLDFEECQKDLAHAFIRFSQTKNGAKALSDTPYKLQIQLVKYGNFYAKVSKKNDSFTVTLSDELFSSHLFKKNDKQEALPIVLAQAFEQIRLLRLFPEKQKYTPQTIYNFKSLASAVQKAEACETLRELTVLYPDEFSKVAEKIKLSEYDAYLKDFDECKMQMKAVGENSPKDKLPVFVKSNLIKNQLASRRFFIYSGDWHENQEIMTVKKVLDDLFRPYAPYLKADSLSKKSQEGKEIISKEQTSFKLSPFRAYVMGNITGGRYME